MQLKGAIEQLKGLQCFFEENQINNDENIKAFSIVFETLVSTELNVVIEKIETLKSVFETRQHETHETLEHIVEQLKSITLKTVDQPTETRQRKKSSFGQSLVNKSRNEIS